MIGSRIKEERERLSLTQQGIADAIGVAKRTFIDWEKDRTAPTAVQLSALSDIGVDVLYVVTGKVQHEASEKKENSEIDEILFKKIVQKLEFLARSTNRRWRQDELTLLTVKIYNFLIKESAFDDDRIDRVLKLVVNN